VLGEHSEAKVKEALGEHSEVFKVLLFLYCNKVITQTFKVIM